jgi:hypothetical protein
MQRQIIDLFERRHRQDRRIAISAWMARLAGLFGVEPSRDHVIADPDRETSVLDEGGVIVFPVAEAIGSLGFLFLHKSRIPTLLSPCFIQQSQ